MNTTTARIKTISRIPRNRQYITLSYTSYHRCNSNFQRVHSYASIYTHPYTPTRNKPSPATAIILTALTALVGWYSYQSYKYYGYPTELMKLLADADQHIQLADNTNSAHDKMKYYAYAEQQLIQALQYIDARTPMSDRSDFKAIQHSTRSSSNNKIIQYKNNVTNAPVVNINYINPMLLPHTMLKLAYVIHAQGNCTIDQCEPLYIKSIKLYTRKFGGSSVQLISPMRQLAELYYDNKQYDRALSKLQQAYDIMNHVRHQLPCNDMSTPHDEYQSTSRVIRDYISISNAIDRISGYINNNNRQLTQSDAIIALSSQEAESELTQQMSTVYRDSNQIESSIKWSIYSYNLLQQYINPILKSYYINNSDNTGDSDNIIDLTQLQHVTTSDNLHRNRRLLNLLNEITHDYHLQHNDTLALNAAVSSTSLLYALTHIYTTHTLPAFTVAQSLLLPDSIANNNYTVPNRTQLQSIQLLCEQTVESVKHAEQQGLNLRLESIASLCNLSTILYSTQHKSLADKIYQLTADLSKQSNYSNTRIEELKQLLQGKQL